MKADVAREKYVHLMTEIEDLEDRIERFENKSSKKKAPKAFTEGDITMMKEALAAKKNELARISDGCGKPHAH
jgi:predicted  nucleic acid-binding Zn-ribbon protein